PVQMIPSCDQTGVVHFHSSTTPGSAALTRARSRESISPRQSPRAAIFASMSADGEPAEVVFTAVCVADLLAFDGFAARTALRARGTLEVGMGPFALS